MHKFFKEIGLGSRVKLGRVFKVFEVGSLTSKSEWVNLIVVIVKMQTNHINFYTKIFLSKWNAFQVFCNKMFGELLWHFKIWKWGKNWI